MVNAMYFATAAILIAETFAVARLYIKRGRLSNRDFMVALVILSIGGLLLGMMWS